MGPRGARAYGLRPRLWLLVEGESGRKRENTCRIYISSEDVQGLKGSRKDCKMIFQARTEEK